MPLPTPQEGQTQAEFMRVCMHEISQSDTERPQEQRVAICLRAWREGKSESLVGLAKEVDALVKEREQRLRAWLHEGVEFDEG